jgi:hypothetical protein
MATLPYPTPFSPTLESIFNWARSISRIRTDDVGDYTNLPNIYMRGRKVGKVPTSATDIAVDDRIGDFNYDTVYFYFVVDTGGGVAQWRTLPVTNFTGGGGGLGTVTAVSVVSANGLAGSVATPFTTPAITLSTSITGLLKGNGTAISAAVSGTDYQPAGNYVTALTGDVAATGPGSATATLATVNANVGSFGTATQAGTFTVNAKGLITAASNTAIQIAESQVTNLVSDLAGKQATGNYVTALTGDGTASGPGSAALTLATVNASVGSFTNASITVNGKGLITAASSGTAPVTSVSGTANRITSSGGTTPVIDIAATYVGQASITTLGTIATGAWQGTKIGLAYGGTNADMSATGGASQVLKQASAGAAVTVGQLAASDLSNGTTGTGAVVLAALPSFTSGMIYKTRVVTAAGAVTVATSDYYIGVNKTVGAATTVNLPAAPTTGTTFIIKDEKGDAATNNITITPAAGNIDNAATFVMATNNQSATVIYSGSQWVVN